MSIPNLEVISRSNRLPLDFWHNLIPEQIDPALHSNEEGFALSHCSHLGTLKVTTKRQDVCLSGESESVYSVTVTDIPNLEPRLQFSSGVTFSNFNEAIGMHYAALHKLYSLGY